jgi:hypothetical protein
MLSTARTTLSIDPGGAEVTPLPKMIDTFDAGGVR